MTILVVEVVIMSKYLVLVVLTTAVTWEAETVETVAMSQGESNNSDRHN
jgi:hypothetical protein